MCIYLFFPMRHSIILSLCINVHFFPNWFSLYLSPSFFQKTYMDMGCRHGPGQANRAHGACLPPFDVKYCKLLVDMHIYSSHGHGHRTWADKQGHGPQLLMSSIASCWWTAHASGRKLALFMPNLFTEQG